ncbi:MAG: type I restriction-modification system subunit M [Phaeodactylibacter sp.]|nr:type I restriction-modification system subunit M [Phaeodactylibacter sp.]
MPPTTRKELQQKINATLWAACDTFRGVVDPAEYKNYILVFLFLKYLSDVWKDKLEQYRQQYGDDEERIQRKMQREPFVLPENATFDYIVSKKQDDQIGQVINTVLEHIEDHERNREKLSGVFRGIDFNSEANLGRVKDRKRRLGNLIDDFNKPILDFRPSVIGSMDVIGNAYMYLIERFASDAGKKGGEFYTPHEVSQLLAQLVAPKKGERICDPTCGSGSLLITVAEEVGGRDFAVYGQESNGSTWALCKMNMFLHEMDARGIQWGDTLNNPRLKEENNELMRFDVVVANPPFSLDKWGAENAGEDPHRRFWRGVPPKSKADYAFICHMIETAYEGHGRVGVIVPHGVLFRGGSEGKIRQKLIEENLLDAVIGLPANLFYGTGIPAAILLFDKGRGDNKNVLFIDASQEYDSGKNQNHMAEKQIGRAVSVFKAYKAGACEPGVVEDKYAYLATFEELAENEFNLNIPRYVDTFEEEEPVDMEAVQHKITELNGRLSELEDQMEGYLSELNLKF